MNIPINVEGREALLSNCIRATVGDYTIYNNKIWKVVAYYGTAIGNCKDLERSKAGERLSIPNSEKIYKLMKPTGYIDI